MFCRFLFLIACGALCLALSAASAQTLDDSVRVTVTMNPDGSKTVYQVDGAKNESVATTTDAKGKAVGKILYKLDGQGRYETGQVFGPDGKLRFKTAYQYDAGGRLTEETHLGKDDVVQNKIVYSYDAVGHQTGYAVYDANGKLIGRTTPKKPAENRPRR
jgi:YD repeat-containing protein